MIVEELAREIVASIDMEEGYITAQKWISRRYQELAALLPLRTLLKFGEVVVPGVYRTGIVTVAQGLNSVVGSGTNWSGVLVGRYFRRARNWYEIQAVVNSTHLTLTSHYTEPSSSGVPYSIVPRRTPLIPGVRRIQEMRSSASSMPLELLGIAELDIQEPSRDLISSSPSIAAEVGIDTTVEPAVRIFEFYPYPLLDTLISFTYHQAPQEFIFSDRLPDFIDPGVLKEGAMIDAYRFQMGKSLKDGRPDIAGFWRNELRAQETTWRLKLQEVVQTTMGVDSGTLILRKNRGSKKGIC